MFVAEDKSKNDISFKLIDDIKLDDRGLTTDFDRKVACSGYIYAVISHVSNADVRSEGIDSTPLSLMDNAFADDTRSGTGIQYGGVTSSRSMSESKVVIDLIVTSCQDENGFLVEKLPLDSSPRTTELSDGFRIK